MTISDIMTRAPIIPVLVIDDLSHAVLVAEALVDGGLPVIEVTLRTTCAIDVIKAMRTVAGAVVGAGTVLDPDDLSRAIDAGAEFIVAPGLTQGLGRAAINAGIPFLPGVATATDLMNGLDQGFDRFKFFPAETSGGIAALKALSGPFGNVRFCPTGGITARTAADWLALPSVDCVGGSWIVPRGAPDTGAITVAAREAVGRSGR